MLRGPSARADRVLGAVGLAVGGDAAFDDAVDGGAVDVEDLGGAGLVAGDWAGPLPGQ